MSDSSSSLVLKADFHLPYDILSNLVRLRRLELQDVLRRMTDRRDPVALIQTFCVQLLSDVTSELIQLRGSSNTPNSRIEFLEELCDELMRQIDDIAKRR